MNEKMLSEFVVKTNGFQPFSYNRPVLENVGPNCPHKALMSKNKKGLHVLRSTVFPLKIGEEQKKSACGPQFAQLWHLRFFLYFYVTSLFATHL